MRLGRRKISFSVGFSSSCTTLSKPHIHPCSVRWQNAKGNEREKENVIINLHIIGISYHQQKKENLYAVQCANDVLPRIMQMLFKLNFKIFKGISSIVRERREGKNFTFKVQLPQGKMNW